MLNLKKRNVMLLVLVTAAGMLSGCGKKEESIISSELVSEEAGFGQDTAKTGDFVETQTYDAKRVYPISNVITSPYDGVWLKEINVEAGQAVKKGDLLVSIEPVTEELLAKKEAAIEKNKQDTQAVLSGYQASIDTLSQNASASSKTQQKLYQAQLQKTQEQYNWYQKTAVKDQADMTQELEYLRSLQGDLNIYAPYDGVIDTISNVQENTELDTSRELLSMHSEEQIMLEVTEGSSLRYGQTVTVETGSGENIKSYPGTVISADNVHSDGLKTGSAIVSIEGEVSAEELGNVRVKANTKELHQVLVVKNYAVSKEKDAQYVSIILGDKIMKRRVLTGGSCGEFTWILQGLEENQTVTIQ